MFDIYLASQSPRRAELLQILNVNFKQFSVDIDESIKHDENPNSYIDRIVDMKLEAAIKSVGDSKPVLVADTIVVFNDMIMCKPSSFEESKRMLNLLSGNTHKVITKLKVAFNGGVHQSTNNSFVTFRNISEKEIQSYWKTGEPIDKSGSYGIQGVGAIFIEKIIGSYTAIMGLPHFEVSQILDQCGVSILD